MPYARPVIELISPRAQNPGDPQPSVKWDLVPRDGGVAPPQPVVRNVTVHAVQRLRSSEVAASSV
eukprot:scaffold52868_cov63-Phaeocystis_antarctica.AAC.2